VRAWSIMAESSGAFLKAILDWIMAGNLMNCSSPKAFSLKFPGDTFLVLYILDKVLHCRSEDDLTESVGLWISRETLCMRPHRRNREFTRSILEMPGRDDIITTAVNYSLNCARYRDPMVDLGVTIVNDYGSLSWSLSKACASALALWGCDLMVEESTG
jgi:hypothetical protein